MLVIACLCVLWILLFLYLMWVGKHLTTFHRQQVSEPQSWPRLSIIVPACNEGAHIEQAVRSLLAQDYPQLQLVLVNDRSSDNTGAIIDGLAATDDRVRAIHIEELPPGWLGKVHAMHCGMQHAEGDWILFTDADIHFHGDVLRKAIAYSVDRGIDHLAMVPRMQMNNFWLQLAVTTFGVMFFVGSRGGVINHRHKFRPPVGIGAFNLVKKATFDRTPGFEWLRLEVVDDVGLGLMLQNAGGQTHFAMAEEELSLDWYPSLRAMFKGLEKNIFGAGARYQVSRVLVQVFLTWLLIAAPWLALFSPEPVLQGLAGLALCVHVWFALSFVRLSRWESAYLLALPLGLVLLSAMLLWSAFQCIRNGGVDWRGTHYSMQELKQGQRVKF
ncbi:MAG: glycosyltransferase [Gammaproteobacteria bacterium]|nr:glycosyltransferase [Gammaproteobacteria bacterium]MDH5801449.1 glycosyltransferase [Gammaproteobacteria bacterium]